MRSEWRAGDHLSLPLLSANWPADYALSLLTPGLRMWLPSEPEKEFHILVFPWSKQLKRSVEAENSFKIQNKIFREQSSTKAEDLRTPPAYVSPSEKQIFVSYFKPLNFNCSGEVEQHKHARVHTAAYFAGIRRSQTHQYPTHLQRDYKYLKSSLNGITVPSLSCLGEAFECDTYWEDAWRKTL